MSISTIDQLPKILMDWRCRRDWGGGVGNADDLQMVAQGSLNFLRLTPCACCHAAPIVTPKRCLPPTCAACCVVRMLAGQVARLPAIAHGFIARKMWTAGSVPVMDVCAV